MSDELKKLQKLFPKNLDIDVLEEPSGNYQIVLRNVTKGGVRKLAKLIVLRAQK